jgi:hypothetical protein
VERSARNGDSTDSIALSSLRPVLEYGWPDGARWLSDGDGASGAATLEQPVRRQVAFRLRVGEDWGLRTGLALPDGAAPGLAWARIALRPPGERETAIWSGVVARAGRPLDREVVAGLGGGRGEVDLVLRVGGIGVDRVRWLKPALQRGGPG